MLSVAALPRVLRSLFTTTANQLARETDFVQRARKLDGAHFAQTLVLGYLSAPTAARSQLQQTAASTGVPVSRQALAQRSTEAAATFLQRLLQTAMTVTFAAARVPPPLLDRCGAVTVGDSTQISLPPALAAVWRGRGGSTPTAGAAALPVQVRLDLCQGTLDTLERRAGRASDQTAAAPDRDHRRQPALQAAALPARARGAAVRSAGHPPWPGPPATALPAAGGARASGDCGVAPPPP